MNNILTILLWSKKTISVIYLSKESTGTATTAEKLLQTEDGSQDERQLSDNQSLGDQQD